MNRGLTTTVLVAVVAVAAFFAGRMGDGVAPSKLAIDPDGTVHIPAFAMPLSNYMTDKAKEVYIAGILNPAKAITDQGIAKHRETHNATFYKPRLEKAEKLYPVNIEDTQMGGVHVEIITPKDGAYGFELRSAGGDLVRVTGRIAK